ncbi:hypothetical protein [Alkalihalobacterium bogoriense]|uniref:hypothetical protein n=1 Tax=Alkalihalobacterium bogoriense TaxID=246272 RepID=UPI000478742B|nr:hypothetical protein [Alkalihalobacterium bogoriense]
MKFKRFSTLFCFTLIMLLMMACNSNTMEDVMREVESTDLSNESIDGIKVGMSINDKSFIAKNGNFELYPDNEHYATRRNYDQYWNQDFIMGVDRETKEILQVGVLEENKTSSSAMGIKIGAFIDEVKVLYGENYYNFEDKDQGIYIIGYIDHQNNVNLSFVHIDNKVIGMSIGYAFDRMEWVQE